jgi:hypothetical protein
LAIVKRRQVADRLDPFGSQPLVGAWPYARQYSQRQRREERGLAARPDNGEAARLAAI